jgi:protein O-mannosyl-transferase
MAPDKLQNTRPGGGDKRIVALICLLLVAAVFLVFGQTVHYDFLNYDDGEQIYEHPVIKNGVSWQGFVWVLTHSDDGHWIPLNKLSHMLDCQLYGLKPGGHHLTNVLLHAATAIFLFLVLRRMMGLRSDKSVGVTAPPAGALWPSAFVAAVFAVHPLRVESVAWVAERKDVLSGFFFMLTFWAYARHAQRLSAVAGRPPGAVGVNPALAPRRWTIDYYLALLFFACGLMSKAIVIMLPLLLLLLDFWPLNRFPQPGAAAANNRPKRRSVFQQLVLEKIPFFVPIVAVGAGLLFSRDRNNVLVAVALQNGQGLLPQKYVQPLAQAGNALLTPLVYLKQMFLPAGLVVFSPPDQNIPLWEICLATIFLAAVTALVWVRRWKQPYLLTGWFWYLVMLAPILVLIQRGAESRCDRYTYLPQIGLYLLLTWAAVDWCAGWRHRRALLGGLATVILATLILCARAQTTHWRNSESLWLHALACNPANAFAHQNLGNVFALEGRSTEAIAEFQQAIRLKPDDTEAHYNLAVTFAAQGRDAEAAEHYRQAIQFNPRHAEACNNLGSLLAGKGRPEEAVKQFQQAVQIKPDYVEARYNLGIALAALGRFDEAIGQFQTAVQLKPDYVAAHLNVGNLLAAQNRLDDAAGHYRRAIELSPGFVLAHYRLAITLQAQRNYGAAIAEFRRVLELDPGQLAARVDLAWLLATCPEPSLRNGNGAIDLAREAARLSPDELPQLLDTLAAAYAEAGQFPKAVATAQRAVDLANARHDPVMAGVIRTRLQLYEMNFPYHERP